VSLFPASNRIRAASFPRHLSDESLVLQAKLGSQDAFTELWSRHGERVRILVWRIIRHREDVEDVLQEVYLKSFTRMDSFNGDALFSTWLSSIGINFALMLLRKRRNRPEVLIGSADSDCLCRSWRPQTGKRTSSNRTSTLSEYRGSGRQSSNCRLSYEMW